MKLIKEAYVSGRTNKFINARLNNIPAFEYSETFELILVTDYPKKLVQMLEDKMNLVKYISDVFYTVHSTEKISVYIIGEKLAKCYENFCWVDTDYVFYDLLKKENVIFKDSFESSLKVHEAENISVKNCENKFIARVKLEEVRFRKEANWLLENDMFEFYNILETVSDKETDNLFKKYTLENLKTSFDKIISVVAI